MDNAAIKRIHQAHIDDVKDTKFSVKYIKMFDEAWNEVTKRFKPRPRLKTRARR